ncbi:bacterio-opsin activator domain-containing protein [Halostella litorea]|uniref:bacterio-opsin activator domain-containing protein n=1 Tax=Halostella litorea TaxID=2528831 RepID=UPI001091A03D|nr:bacterio-opsin activator domain-containing protein [Halostella litorea]
MNATRGTDDPTFRVLFVGPPEWRARAEHALDGVDGARGESVRTAQAAARSLSAGDQYDCVVSAAELADATGREFAERAAVRDADLPVVLVPGEASTSEADGTDAAATLSWVVPLDGSRPGPTGIEGLANVLAREREFSRRRRAAPFDAAFEDPDRFVAVLDGDGTVRTLNDAAEAYLDASADAVAGKRFWALPWRDGQPARRAIQRAVKRAGDGEYTTFEGTLAAGDADDGSTLEFRVQPAGDDPDAVLVQGENRAERDQLEAELRSSEELHRVTLNNMTETVLVTNDDGEFTYVCPNVHFIFGYTAEEIHEFGTIDELLGNDPADPDRLADEGVVRNVEHTATDKDGEEHTLLVNVRNVSIQDGTRLYSCRDVTKRKQRERALTQVQRTSRELLYAETKAAVANRVVSDATTALTGGGAVLYGFDGDENVLYPMAASDRVRAALGPLPDASLGGRSPVGAAFVEERTTDLDESGDRPGGPLASLADLTAIPLGDHGVLAVGAVDGALSAVDREVGELLAATAEAAFDRLERERELRERDATLQERNRRLSELNRVNEMIREIDQALVNAETREGIVEAVCERLSAEDRFAFAWVGEPAAHGQRLRPLEWAGDNREYLDAVSLSTAEAGTLPEPAVRTCRERTMTVVPNVADRLREAGWCKEAVSRNFDSALSIPLTYDGVLLGTLAVYDDEPDAFSETVQAVFSELGDTIGAAINGIQRKEALQSDTVFRLSYRIEDRSALLHRVAAAADCTLELRTEVARSDGATRLFLAVTDADAEAVVEAAAALVDVTDATAVRSTDDGGLVSLTVRDGALSAALAGHGATRRTLEATSRGIDLVVDVPDAATVRAVDDLLSGTFADVELVAQRNRTRPSAPEEPGADLLTDRQAEVAQVAYHSGFFEADRDVTGRDVAATLDISHTAFYDHVKRAERKLFAALFEGGDSSEWVE